MDNIQTRIIPYAGMWRRLGANLIDANIIIIPFFFLLNWVQTTSKPVALILILPIAFISTFYTIFFHAKYGQTLGKMAVKIQVQTIDFQSINWVQALTRSSFDLLFSILSCISSFIIISGIPEANFTDLTARELGRYFEFVERPFFKISLDISVLWLISEIIVVLFNKKKRALHDFLAKTIVVIIEDPLPYKNFWYKLLNFIYILILLALLFVQVFISWRLGKRSLEIVVENDEIQILKELVEKDKNLINFKNINRQNLLHLASDRDFFQNKKNNSVIEYLLEKKINPNSQDIVGNTPLHIATRTGNFSAIYMFISNGANVKIKNSNNEDAIDLASAYGYRDIVRLFKSTLTEKNF